MSDKALKIVPSTEAKSSSENKADAPAKAGIFARIDRKRLRTILLVAVPLIAVVIGFGIYLTGGRYVSTDNAYVGAQKVLITPDIAGKIVHVAIREGQFVRAGDELFMLDRQPYALALEQARAKLDAARTNYEKATTSLKSLQAMADLSQKSVELKQRDFDRKTKLVASQAGSAADVDTSAAALVTAQSLAQLTIQQRDTTLSQLLGNPSLPLERFPEYAQAKAALDEAQRNFDHTIIRAPIAGTATQVDNIQLGRFIPAGNPVLSVVDDQTPWVDANPKETDLTYLRVGQKVTIEVDSFPDHTFTGKVSSVSPGTGAQFSILPPQNASGNWVKVVQRVPVRIALDKDDDLRLLRSGMSATVSIDTGHSRLPFGSAVAKEVQ